ncbi:MAG: hypothetical protein HY306_08725 [Nitrosomonadales bacterium]|nr:hypothetical protein [Nitrosomonadales bacterium]
MKIPNLGMKSMWDLRRVIEDAIHAEITIETPVVNEDTLPPVKEADIAQPYLVAEKEKLEVVRSVPFDELLKRCQVSARLRNCMKVAIGNGSFPFDTIGDYLDKGAAGIPLLMKIPNLGRATARELHTLIEYGLGREIRGNSYSGLVSKTTSEPEITHTKQLVLVDQLEEKYPMVFWPLIDRYRDASETDLLVCINLEIRMQKLLSKSRDAEICQRRFYGETLESIAQSLNPVMTRERVRQIENKYKKHITDIYSEGWLTRAVQSLLARQEEPSQFPANDVLKSFHPQLQFALRQVFLPDSHQSGSLTKQERHDLAERFGFDGYV